MMFEVGSLQNYGKVKLKPIVSVNSIAHLQVTSGSTGNPKLVIVRHSNINANVQAIARAVELRDNDRVVSWLPLIMTRV